MKNNISKSLWLSLLFAAAVFIGCSDDDNASNYPPKLFIQVYDVPGSQALNDYTMLKGKITITPEGREAKIPIDVKFPVRSTRTATSNLSLTMKVEKSLIDQFNTDNHTDYLPVPEGLIQLTNPTLHIEKGAEIAYDSVRVEMLSSGLNLLDPDKTYLAPIAITGIDGSNDVVVSSNRGALYVVIAAINVNINGLVSVNDMTGTLVSSRTGWTAEGSGVTNPGNAINTSTSNYATISAANVSSAVLTINMGAQKTLTGLRIRPRSGSYAFKAVQMLTSTDGKNYTSQGETDVTVITASPYYQYIKFYTPVSAQYFRFTGFVPNATSGVSLTELTVYEQN